MRYAPTLSFCLAAFTGVCQTAPGPVPGGPFVISEDVGLAMNRAQVFAAAQDAWAASFAQEPGAQVSLTDAENGLIEGSARMNYRGKMLMGREETMGTVTYQVSIKATNGQCHVRIHNIRHTGNRGARGGGLNVGPILVGEAPSERYPGMGLGPSRRIHAEVREAAANRLRENLRRFAARLRLLGGE